MRAGYAAADITPPAGIELTGFIAREGPATGAHDPLLARALVFEDAGSTAAIVSCDLIGLGRNLVHRVRRRVAALAGVPADALLFACTHTHGGPETGLLTTIARPDPDYLEGLEERLVAVVAAAVAALRPARLGFGRGASRVAVNRVRARVGRGGDIDPEVAVVRVEDEVGAPLAAVVGYACHAVAAGAETRLANADYPGYLARAMEAAGCGPTVFVNGAGADLNPDDGGSRGHAAAERIGRLLAAEAVRVWREIVPRVSGGVSGARLEVELPLLPTPDASHAASLLRDGTREIARLPVDSWQRRAVEVTHLQHGGRLTQLHFGRTEPPRVVTEVQVLKIGELAIVGLPGESFSDLGKAIRAAAGGPTLVAGWANDVVGYLPDRAAYELGGYEVEIAHRYYGLPAAFAPEAGERLVLAARDLLRRGG